MNIFEWMFCSAVVGTPFIAFFTNDGAPKGWICFASITILSIGSLFSFAYNMKCIKNGDVSPEERFGITMF